MRTEGKVPKLEMAEGWLRVERKCQDCGKTWRIRVWKFDKRALLKKVIRCVACGHRVMLEMSWTHGLSVKYATPTHVRDRMDLYTNRAENWMPLFPNYSTPYDDPSNPLSVTGVKMDLKVGQEVTINTPENYRLHRARGVVKAVHDWGATLATLAAATGEFRAYWDEMLTGRELEGMDTELPSRQKLTFTGEVCKCGGLMVRTGTCLTCQSCGTSSGGCS